LRRSGRVKSKGPIVGENKVSDAYSIDGESSGDDVVDGFGKGIEVGKRVEKKGCGSNVPDSNDDKGKNDTERNSGAVKKGKKSDMIGDDKENIQKFKMTKGESSKASTSKPKKQKGEKLYVFQTRTSRKTLYNAIVTLKPIQKACLARIGFAGLLDFNVDEIPSKLGFYVVENFIEHKMEIKLNDKSIVITKQMIGEMLQIRNDGLDILAQENTNDDEMLKDWDAQFNKGKDITPSYLKFLIWKFKVADMNFKLNFIVLLTSVMGSVKPRGICDLSVLHNISRKADLAKINLCEYMLYVDGTICNEFNVGWKRPPTSFRTIKLLKKREYEEINSGGIGKASDLFRGNPSIGDVSQQYRAALHYKNGGNEGKSSDLHRDNNDEPQQVTTLQEAVNKKRLTMDANSKDGSSVFALGPSTKKEVLTMVDKVVEEFESSKKGNVESSTKGNDFEPPSFSFGVTQDIEKVSAIGTKTSRKQIETLVNGEKIDDGVVDAWSEHLKSLESLRPENSMSKIFLTDVYCDKKVFTIDEKAIVSINNFLRVVETENERVGRKNMINLVDLVFIPFSNYGHEFLICINQKFLAVNMIDSKNNLIKGGFHKSIIVTNTNDMHKCFCQYLVRKNPNKADKRPNDSSVFDAPHGGKYVATLILSECNMHRDSVRAQLDGIEVADVPVKRMKLPKGGK
nr:hypothetical protein [Tanacetum cinerariifolium]